MVRELCFREGKERGDSPITNCTTSGCSTWRPQCTEMFPGWEAMVDTAACHVLSASPVVRSVPGRRGRVAISVARRGIGGD